MIKEQVWKKKFFLKRIRITQETDLKIPKALNNRVFNNGYSKHFRICLGDKVKIMIKEHVWKKKFFLKRIRTENYQRRLSTVFLITVTAYDLGDKVEENDKRTCLEKKIFPQTHSNNAGNGSKKAGIRITDLKQFLGDKVEENDKRTCLEKKISPQTHSKKAGNRFENSKGA